MSRTPVFVSVLLVAGLARAEPVADPAALESARRLFKEATALEAESDWAAAEQKLREAIAVKETPGLRYHLAFCEAQQGKLVQALADYDRAQALIDAGVAAPDVQTLLTSARAELARRVPSLTLQLPERVRSFRLLVDGRAVLLESDRTLRIDPGSHGVELLADGHYPFTATVDVIEGERRTLVVDPTPSPAPTAPAPVAPASAVSPGPAPESRGSTKLAVLIGEAGVVVVGLGVGIWGLAARASARDRRDDATRALDNSPGGQEPWACSPSGPDDLIPACNERKSAQDDFETATTLTNVGFIAAGVGAAAAIGTYLLWPSDGARGPAASVRAVVGPHGAFAGVRGNF